MENKPYAVLTTTIVVALVCLALWQFYSLVWGDPLSDLASIGVLPSR